MRILSITADVCGILGFFLTLFLLIRSEALRKEIAMQKKDYIRSQVEVMRALRAIRDNIADGKDIDLKVICRIREQMYAFDQQYNRLWSISDKVHLRALLRVLTKGEDNVSNIKPEKLCSHLDYFIGRFHRKEAI